MGAANAARIRRRLAKRPDPRTRPEAEEDRVDLTNDDKGSMDDAAPTPQAERGPPSALIVGGSPGLVGLVRSAAEPCGIEVMATERGDAARTAIVQRRYDVVLLVDDDDGEGVGTAGVFAQLVHRLAPTSKTMLLAERLSVDAILEAMRRGAVDYVQTPFEAKDFGSRLLAAVARSRDDRDREERVLRLKGICKRLSRSRSRRSEEAKALSDDLRSVRDGMAERLDEVAMTAEYRTLLRQELDIDDLLRVGVEYLVGKTGPTNAAVFLPGGDGGWSLGAYVNCDCPRGVVQPMLDRLAEDLCPEMARLDELMRFEDSAEFTRSLALGHEPLERCEMVAWPCHSEGDCLAVFVLFRDGATGFADGLASVIDALRGVFAEQIRTVLRIHHRALGGWPAGSADADADDEGDEWDDRAAA